MSNLVGVLMVDSSLPPDALEGRFLADWNESTDNSEYLHVVVSQVASLTDNPALALYSILRWGRVGWVLPSVLLREPAPLGWGGLSS